MEKKTVAHVTREDTTRTSVERKKVWTPPERLPDFSSKMPGYHLRWVRRELRGENADANVLARIRQGYEVVTPEEIGVTDVTTLDDGRFAGTVCSGDLILMKIDVDMANQRKDYYLEQARKMQRVVDKQLEENQQSTMPISKSVSNHVQMGRPRFKEEPES